MTTDEGGAMTSGRAGLRDQRARAGLRQTGAGHDRLARDVTSGALAQGSGHRTWTDRRGGGLLFFCCSSITNKVPQTTTRNEVLQGS